MCFLAFLYISQSIMQQSKLLLLSLLRPKHNNFTMTLLKPLKTTLELNVFLFFPRVIQGHTILWLLFPFTLFLSLTHSSYISENPFPFWPVLLPLLIASRPATALNLQTQHSSTKAHTKKHNPTNPHVLSCPNVSVQLTEPPQEKDNFFCSILSFSQHSSIPSGTESIETFWKTAKLSW